MKTMSLGDTGTKLLITVADENGIVDLSGATLLQIKLKRPNGQRVVKTAQLQGPATSGVIGYTTQANDLNAVGVWEVVAHIEFADAAWTTLPESFAVV